MACPHLLYSGENAQIDNAKQILQKKSEVYVSFDVDDLSNNLNYHLSVDLIENNIVYAYANNWSFAELLKENIPFNIEKHPGDVDFDVNMKSWEEIQDKGSKNTWDYYPTYDAYVNMMYQFAEDFPEMCEIHDAGSTVNGRQLLFARINPDLSNTNAKPMFMYTSTIHGDETTGFVLMLRLIDYLLSNYNSDVEITNLLDDVEIWICPNENPDGTYTNDNSTVSGATRGNANGVDLNRNYPNPVNPPPQGEQAETTAMIDFVSDKNFIMSANFHGGIELVNYPFDSWTSIERKHADHNWFEFISREYADTAQYFSPDNYMTAYGGVTHGGDWYVVYGSRQDYMNYYRSDREVTIEISETKLLNPALLPDYWDYNYRSFINYIKQSAYGVQGYITDIETGDPIPAKVTVLDHDQYNSEVYASVESGFYTRPLLSGTYDLTFYLYGFDAVTISDVNVSNYETTIVDVELQAWETNISDVSLNANIYIAPNPVISKSKLFINNAKSLRTRIDVYNIQGMAVASVFNDIILESNFEISLANMQKKLSPGVYFIKISNESASKVIKALVL